MLTWHYRSQYEALIQFSNAAFYEGRLATIPDRTLTHVRARPLRGDGRRRPRADDVVAAVDGLLERSISAMRVLDGVYTQRTNPQEAVWIAHLVRELAGARDRSDARDRRVLGGAAVARSSGRWSGSAARTPSSPGCTTPS